MASDQLELTIEKLHRDHADGIRRYLARLVGTSDAEDLAQDVFEKAQRAIGTFRGDSRALTWLYRLATNAAIDRLRSLERRAAHELDDAAGEPGAGDRIEEASDRRSVDAVVDRARMRECILAVVEQLPASQRAVILLGELRGLSDRETADALGISVGAAKIRLHRARRVLKAALERACSFERDDENELACAPKVGSVISLQRRR